MRIIAERPHLIADDGQIIVQIDPKEYEELELTSFREVRQKRYGNTILVFYAKTQAASTN
jgi:16S rRNA G966 N2-methylase RsmD